MKKFGRIKTLDEIRTQCEAQGVPFDDSAHGTGESDGIVVGGPIGQSAYAIYCTFNGRFFGQTDNQVEFDSSETVHEAEPWFQQLLAFFYAERGAQ